MEYIPYNGGGKAFRDQIKNLADDLELGENYAIVGMRSTSTTIFSIQTDKTDAMQF